MKKHPWSICKLRKDKKYFVSCVKISINVLFHAGPKLKFVLLQPLLLAHFFAYFRPPAPSPVFDSSMLS